MKIIVAPDSFKGSISASGVCNSVKEGILRVLPDADIHLLPLADGGEGTMENLVAASRGTMKFATVCGPLKEKVKAKYGVLGDGKTVVIEMAQASGLPLISETKRNPLITTSYGTGDLIKLALNEGYREFIVGLGGSATNDGGAGMLRALGMEFYSRDGEVLEGDGGSLSKLAYYDDSHFDHRLKESTFVIASDVTNKLCGENGASFVFGPQKGATPQMVEKLDQALFQFSEVIYKQKGINIRELIGGGAAGGMGSALLAFFNSELKTGINVILEKIKFNIEIEDADLIITGEGKLDEQTKSGKVIKGVSQMAKEKGIPVIALCGRIDLKHSDLDRLGLLSAFSIVPGPCSLDEAFKHSASWITEQTESIMKILKYKLN